MATQTLENAPLTALAARALWEVHPEVPTPSALARLPRLSTASNLHHIHSPYSCQLGSHVDGRDAPPSSAMQRVCHLFAESRATPSRAWKRGMCKTCTGARLRGWDVGSGIACDIWHHRWPHCALSGMFAQCCRCPAIGVELKARVAHERCKIITPELLSALAR